jgi:hypothetical protein
MQILEANQTYYRLVLCGCFGRANTARYNAFGSRDFAAWGIRELCLNVAPFKLIFQMALYAEDIFFYSAVRHRRKEHYVRGLS